MDPEITKEYINIYEYTITVPMFLKRLITFKRLEALIPPKNSPKAG